MSENKSSIKKPLVDMYNNSLISLGDVSNKIRDFAEKLVGRNMSVPMTERTFTIFEKLRLNNNTQYQSIISQCKILKTKSRQEQIAGVSQIFE